MKLRFTRNRFIYYLQRLIWLVFFIGTTTFIIATSIFLFFWLFFKITEIFLPNLFSLNQQILTTAIVTFASGFVATIASLYNGIKICAGSRFRYKWDKLIYLLKGIIWLICFMSIWTFAIMVFTIIFFWLFFQVYTLFYPNLYSTAQQISITRAMTFVLGCNGAIGSLFIGLQILELGENRIR